MPDSISPSSFPQFMENSHDGGSSASIRVFITALCLWEIMYHIARYSLKIVLKNYPNIILSSTLSNGAAKNGSNDASNGNVNVNAKSNSPLDTAKHTLVQRGPSYIVSFLHALYATWRGTIHLLHLGNAPSLYKVFISRTHTPGAFRWAAMEVTESNTVFLAYLTYDLLHILALYPKLGGVDTILHHLIFASCSYINGTFGILPYAFGWLYIGEASTIFLNIRWFLLKSGRENSNLLDKMNQYFAGTFFLTRVGIYTVGVVHLFYCNLPEMMSLPEKSGVPISLLAMTVGCLLLGWALNMLWGYKIFGMVNGKKGKTKQQ